jgi:hypothetical protein
MAIEIRQLVIRAVVDDGGRSSPARLGSGLGSGPDDSPSTRMNTREQTDTLRAAELGVDERKAIVNACVREVLRKLERARER